MKREALKHQACLPLEALSTHETDSEAQVIKIKCLGFRV